jgi:hypothetical protein
MAPIWQPSVVTLIADRMVHVPRPQRSQLPVRFKDAGDDRGPEDGMEVLVEDPLAEARHAPAFVTANRTSVTKSV